jgi:hypothetical protein
VATLCKTISALTANATAKNIATMCKYLKTTNSCTTSPVGRKSDRLSRREHAEESIKRRATTNRVAALSNPDSARDVIRRVLHVLNVDAVLSAARPDD